MSTSNGYGPTAIDVPGRLLAGPPSAAAPRDGDTPVTAAASRPAMPGAGGGGVVDFDAEKELRDRVSTRLASEAGFEALDPEAQRLRKRTVATEELQAWVYHRTSLGRAAPSVQDEDALIEAVLDGLDGLGRLRPLLTRGDVEDIFYNGTSPVWLRLASGEMVRSDPIARSDGELRNLLMQLGTSLGDGSARELSEAHPLLALRLKAVGDGLGARLSAATDVTPHPVGTIRIHRHAEADLAEAYRLRMIDKPLCEFLRVAVYAGLKVAIVGAMGHGKTFLLRAMSSEIPIHKVIATIEDERELGLHILPARDADGVIRRYPDGSVIPRRPEALVKAYESRPANAEGYGAITVEDLLRHTLRDSDDVIVLGESRGGEIVQFLDAASNGTAGVMGTWHANSAGEVFDRIVQMVLKAKPPLPTEWALRASTALDLVVFVDRNTRRGGRRERFVSEVLEVQSGHLGENGLPVTHHLFAPREDGRAVPTGRKPGAKSMVKLAEVGFSADWLEVSEQTRRAVHSDWDRPDEDGPR